MKNKFPLVSDGVIKLLTFETTHLTKKYVSWLNDANIVKYSQQRHKKHSLISCKKYYDEQQSSNNYFLAIELEDEKSTHVGNIGIAVDNNNKIADLAIIVCKSVWGLGIGSRAWILALNSIFEHLDIRMVTCETMAINQPMINLIKRSKMKINATLPKRFIFEGKEVDKVVASIIKK